LKFIIEPLGARHDRAAFACGIPALDSYLQTQARQDFKKRVAVPFVITPDHETVAGYYTLSQYAVKLDEVPEDLARKLPKYPMVPVTLIGRLAIASTFRGRRLGEQLLMDALNRALGSTKEVASAAVIVDAKGDDAIAFYKKYGFVALPMVERRLLLPMGTVAKLFA
jgi:predicted GNAT family N-acyltransferase